MAIIIGDLHGNVQKTRAFLNHKPDQMHIQLGDVLGRNTVELGVESLRLLLDSSAVLLWGNHELSYVRSRHNWDINVEPVLNELVEANKFRFQAAVDVDGWLLTHAGLVRDIRQKYRTKNVEKLAAFFNESMTRFLLGRRLGAREEELYSVGFGRQAAFAKGPGGIFWHDYRVEFGLDTEIKQIFGHTQSQEPVVTGTYVALDTTSIKDHGWLYDTSLNELVDVRW